MSDKPASTTGEEAFEAGEILFEQVGAVATLTFNRPKVRNALTFGMYEALYDTCVRVDQDDTI
jgi:enoyl-CoA hydratase/carnithine racemase